LWTLKAFPHLTKSPFRRLKVGVCAERSPTEEVRSSTMPQRQSVAELCSWACRRWSMNSTKHQVTHAGWTMYNFTNACKLRDQRKKRKEREGVGNPHQTLESWAGMWQHHWWEDLVVSLTTEERFSLGLKEGTESGSTGPVPDEWIHHFESPVRNRWDYKLLGVAGEEGPIWETKTKHLISLICF